jgi:hypothetical protein
MADYTKLKAEYEALKDKKQRVDAQKEIYLKTLQDLGCPDLESAIAETDRLIDEAVGLEQQLQDHMKKIEAVLEKTR